MKFVPIGEKIYAQEEKAEKADLEVLEHDQEPPVDLVEARPPGKKGNRCYKLLWSKLPEESDVDVVLGQPFFSSALFLDPWILFGFDIFGDLRTHTALEHQLMQQLDLQPQCALISQTSACGGNLSCWYH